MIYYILIIVFIVPPIQQFFSLFLVLGMDGIDIVIQLLAHLLVVVSPAIIYLRPIVITSCSINLSIIALFTIASAIIVLLPIVILGIVQA